MAAPAKRKLVELGLKEKVDMLSWLEKPGTSERSTAAKYGVSKTTVSNIKKQKLKILFHYANGLGNLNRKRKIRRSEFKEVNVMTWTWFQRMRELNLPVTGPMIQRTARIFAESMQVPNFAGSNGWLQSWKRLYNIQHLNAAEVLDVNVPNLEKCKLNIQHLTRGLHEEVLNLNRMRVFPPGQQNRDEIEGNIQERQDGIEQERNDNNEKDVVQPAASTSDNDNDPAVEQNSSIDSSMEEVDLANAMSIMQAYLTSNMPSQLPIFFDLKDSIETTIIFNKI